MTRSWTTILYTTTGVSVSEEEGATVGTGVGDTCPSTSDHSRMSTTGPVQAPSRPTFPTTSDPPITTDVGPDTSDGPCRTGRGPQLPVSGRTGSGGQGTGGCRTGPSSGRPCTGTRYRAGRRRRGCGTTIAPPSGGPTSSGLPGTSCADPAGGWCPQRPQHSTSPSEVPSPTTCRHPRSRRVVSRRRCSGRPVGRSGGTCQRSCPTPTLEVGDRPTTWCPTSAGRTSGSRSPSDLNGRGGRRGRPYVSSSGPDPVCRRPCLRPRRSGGTGRSRVRHPVKGVSRSTSSCRSPEVLGFRHMGPRTGSLYSDVSAGFEYNRLGDLVCRTVDPSHQNVTSYCRVF